MYLNYLLKYNYAVKQRNFLLKSFAVKNYLDKPLLESFTKPLKELGKELYLKREHFVSDFVKYFRQHYSFLSDDKENVSITYRSDLSQKNFNEKLDNNLQRDLLFHRTEMGIHKDDFIFKINDYPLKKFGSQGQQKSFLIALKLAQFDVISFEKKFKPILLLDDIFDKLDDQRIHKLTRMISNNKFGQIFITDAQPERTENILSSIKINSKVFHIKENKIDYI